MERADSGSEIERNPLGCDIETQIIYAEDGTCHDKPPTTPTVTLNQSSFLRFDSSANPNPIFGCSFYHPGGNPEDDDFVWEDCVIQLIFTATADVDQSTNFPEQSYLSLPIQRTKMTSSA